MMLSTKTLLALVPFFIQANAQASGSGKTTRYWDCCKPSCAWPGKADLLGSPVKTCAITDTPLTGSDTANAVNGCDGGSSYMCSDQSPWAVSDDLAYGYAAVNIAGGSESSWCCACYELTFTTTAMAGKKMIVQATNTGGDLGANQFDLAIPGGGVGIFNGCTAEFGAPSSGWGAQYGGISLASACSTFPTALKPGCEWRYGWFEGADNPEVTFKQVSCPAALTAKSGCTRKDDSAAAAPAPVTGQTSSVAPVASSTSVVKPVVSSSAAPVVSSVKPVVSSVAPVVSSAKPVVSSVAPVVSSAKPVVSSVKPVVSSVAPVATSVAPVVVSSAKPVVSSTKGLTTSFVAPSATASAVVPVSSAAGGDGDDGHDACEL